MSEIVHLTIDDGPEKGREITVPPGGAVAGRDEENTIHIVCEELSRKHCRFFFRAGRLHVQDLASANNTFVNDEHIKEKALSVDDVVATGTVKFTVRLNKITPAYDLKTLVETATRIQPPEAAPPPQEQARGVQAKIVASIVLLLVWAFLAISVSYPPPQDTRPTPSPIVAPRVTASAPASFTLRDESALDAFKLHVTRKLLAADSKTASTLVTEHLAPDQSGEYHAELVAMLRIVESVSSMNESIADAFIKQIGVEVTLTRNGRQALITPRAGYGHMIEATIMEEDRQRRITFDVNKLSAIDRLEWLPYPTSPELHAMHVVLNYQAGNLTAATEHARSAGCMSASFAEAISQ